MARGEYEVFESQLYWDCLNQIRRDDPYKADLVDVFCELNAKPFHNPRLSTHDIGKGRNGKTLFSTDVGGRQSNRRLVWQLFGHTIVLLLYGTHKVQERAKRIQVQYDPEQRQVVLSELSSETDEDRPHHEQRQDSGSLFMAWADAELESFGFPSPTVEHLRRLNSLDELDALEEHLGEEMYLRALNLVVEGHPEGKAAAEREAQERQQAAEEAVEATQPEVTEEDLELERKIRDPRTGGWFSRSEPEFMADVVDKPIEDWMVFLHPDQRNAASSVYRGPARIRGPAGTGKTVVGLHWAAARAKRNRDALQEAEQQLVAESSLGLPVLFTTYIRSLPPVMEGLYRRLPGTREDKVKFIHVQALARQVCEEAGERTFVNPKKVGLAFDEAHKQIVHRGTPLANTNLSKNYLRDEVTAVIKGRAMDSLEEYLELSRTGRRVPFSKDHRKQVWELKEAWDAQMRRHGTLDYCDEIVRALHHARQMDKPWYSAVVVDEAQDLTLAGLQLLRALVNAPDHDNDRADGLLILGDGAQRIYPGGFTLRQAGVEVRGRTTILTLNYRNTSQIFEAANAVGGDGDVPDLEDDFQREDEPAAPVRQGPPPLLLEFDGLDAQVEDIAEQINQLVESGQGFGTGDMAVLLYDNKMASITTRLLEETGLEVQQLNDYYGTPNDMVKVGTYHRAKGLEFKVVFLPRLAEGKFPYPARRNRSPEESAEQREMNINQLFVAMTRARDLLFVYHSGTPNNEIAAAEEYFQLTLLPEPDDD